MNLKLWAFRPLALCAAVLAAGCQTYDFEPVQPLAISQTTQDRVLVARAARPELMLLVDKSGSMDLPINAADPDCTSGGLLCGRKGEVDSVPCDVSTCPTRWSELQGAMATFLPNAGNLARMGLSVFPGGTLQNMVAPGCFQPPQPEEVSGAAGVSVGISQSADVPLELEAQATLILNELQSITSSNPPGAHGTGGGTPIGPALQMLGNYPLLTQSAREKFILLLTDGLPNCNPANPNTYTGNPVACACTLDATRCQALSDFGYPREACLDATNSVARAAALNAQDVKTIVVGFGAETSSLEAQTTLNAIATAGGFARNCDPVQGNTCDIGESCDPGSFLCERRYYQAATREQLEDALAEISAFIDPGCKYELDAQPESAAFVLVLFDGESVQTSPSTWQLTPDGFIEFFGSYCDAIRNSTSTDPVNISIRIVQAL